MPRAPRLFLLAALLLPAAPAGTAAPADPYLPTGEVFRYAPTSASFRVLRDPATGDKVFDRLPDGPRRASLEEAVLAEEALLSPLRRRVHHELWPAVEDPARAAETVRVVLVLADQPIRPAAALARERVRPAVEERIAALRAAAGALERAEDPDRLLQLGHRLEEEARQTAPADREGLRALRREVRELLQQARREALAAAAGPAAAARAPLEEALARLPGARVLGRSTVLCSVAAALPAGSLPALLEEVPSVARVLPHGSRRASLDTSVATVGASSWTGAGYDGSSSTLVCVLDTGIDSSHPALSGPVGPEAVFLEAGSQASGFSDDADSDDDFHGHGTHVAGIVMSTDSTYQGVAKGGVLLDGKCGFRLLFEGNYYGSLEDADIMAAGDWAAGQGADAVNGSFGGGGTTDGSSGLTLFFEALVDDLGVFAALAAGNSGPDPGTVTVPGDSFNALTAGSLDDKGSASHTDNSLSSFSGRGPLDDGRRKPDLCAPGANITSCAAAWEGSAADFAASSGTSMATPHAAGAAALLLDYAASWRPEGVKALLLGTTRNTSPYPTSPSDAWGTGGMDLAAAFSSRASTAEGTIASSGRPFAFVRSGSLAAGKRATLCWNREALSAGDGAPETFRAAADLDLFVYEEVDDSARGSSTAALDTVEQVKLSSSSTFPILKIRLQEGFPAGQSEVRWAVATEATTASKVVTPPTLRCAFTSVPALVRGGGEFDATVTVTNDGELPATYPEVTLELPEGFAVVSGANPRTVVTIPAVGDQRTVTWRVRAPGEVPPGASVLRATAVTVSFGETFTAEEGSAEVTVDHSAPEGFLSVEGGRAAVNSPSVDLLVIAFDDLPPLEGLRLRNAGDGWGAWQPFAFALPWTLAAGEGTRTVEAQVRDAAGNESPVFSDAVLLDLTAPSGSVVVNGGAPYAMPWEDLAATGAWGDSEGGSGVAEARHRWNGGPWSEPAEETAGPLPLSRPAAEGPVLLEVEFRDGAGNASAPAADGIHLVEAAPPLLNAVKSWSGTLDEGGDVDAFLVGLLPLDVLTVKAKVKPAARKGEVLPVLDLFHGAGIPMVAGRWPAGARKPGIAGFEATLPGDHWLVLRAGGADAAAGAAVVLSVKVKRLKDRAKAKGTAEPLDGVAEIAVEGVTGSVLSGRISGPAAGEATLTGPDGVEGTLPLEAKGAARVIAPRVLAAGTGPYVIRVPATGPLGFSLSLKPPKGGRAEEGE